MFIVEEEDEYKSSEKAQRYAALKKQKPVIIDQGDDPKLQYNAVFHFNFPVINSFAEAKAVYDSIKPLQGKRAPYDIRPLDPARRHTRFQIRKVSRDEYTVTATYLNALRTLRHNTEFVAALSPKEYRLLSYHRNGTITLYCPAGLRILAKTFWFAPLAPAERAVIWLEPIFNQVKNLLSQVLPAGIYLTEHGWSKFGKSQNKKPYLTIEHKDKTRHYLIPSRKYALKLKQDASGEWQVLNPIQEFKQYLPKEETSRLRKAISKFRAYVNVYWDLVPGAGSSPAWGPILRLSTWKNILQAIERTPWEMLCELHTKTSFGRPNFYSAGEAVKWLSELLRYQRYRAITRQELTYEEVPIGEMCGPWKYFPAFAPGMSSSDRVRPPRLYKRASTESNTKPSNTSACTLSKSLSA